MTEPSIKEDTQKIAAKEQTKRARFKEILKTFLSYNVLQNLAKQEHPEKVREAFESLGPTFIKIGQMLSVRTDILKPAFIKELRKLQDNVKKDDFQTVKTIIEAETELALTDIFLTFEEEAFASASIGQTHKATLLNGQEVAVKVQHAGIKEAIMLDLSLLEKALPLMKYIPKVAVADPREIFLEIKRSLIDELNSLKEAENGQAFYAKNNGWKIVRSPMIYQEYCTSKVLVMEFMEGMSIKQFVKNSTAQPSEREIKQKKYFGDILVQNFVKQVFEDGYFHADPHPGNIFVQLLPTDHQKATETIKEQHIKRSFGFGSASFDYQKEQELPPYRLVFLDFGMMGRIDAAMIQKLTNVMDSLYGNNAKVIGRAILQLCRQTGPLDEDLFFEQLAPLLDNNYDVGIGEMNLQTLFFQIVDICHQNNLQVPQEVTMLIKAVATFEGMIRELDPTISLVEIATPFAKKYFTEKINWEYEAKKAGIDLLYSAKAAPKIPTKLVEALDDFTRGKSKINFELKRQDELLNRIENMVNRVVIGLILAALIVGSSMLVEFHQGVTGNFVSILGIMGYGIALFAIIFLVIDIIRKGRKK
jgi:ubiquinone biosynthesis protein